MNKWLLFLSCIVFSVASFAADSEITPIESPSLICSQPGGTVVLNVDDERLWQADSPADTEGLELTVKSFEKMRCPNCFTVVAEIGFMGAVAEFKYLFRDVPGDMRKAVLTIIAADETGKEEEFANMDCQQAN